MTTQLVLIVDDEAANLDMLSRRLRKRGYEVITAESAMQAREVIARQKPDIVLLDIMMPQVSGLEYLQELRADPKTAAMPVILVTALDQTEDVVKGLDLGANDYVSKPVNMPILLARLRNQLSIGLLLKRLENQNALLSEMAALDELTAVFNRRMGNEVMLKCIAQCQRDKTPLSVALLDIDYFKSVNDRFGHLAGDSVLKGFAERTAASLRAADVMFRYGGEEFCVLFPDTTHERALQICNRLREITMARPFMHENMEIHVTVSVGVSTTVPDSETRPSLLFEEADLALYHAKSSGRNRVCSTLAKSETGS